MNKLNSQIQHLKQLEKQMMYHDSDCEFIDECTRPTDSCYAGSYRTANSRCSKAEINQMIIAKNSKPSNIISLSNSQGVMIQQGDNTDASMTNNSLEHIPNELIADFRKLASNPNKSDWISWLDKFSKVGGSIATLLTLFKMFFPG